ncbi:MAG: energy-coupling factor ABC transporter ATP-binding protein [Planctomycetes bacterium]|nr:energy-coupling factor ABC transporter ATP-binding protein [Planctomycetota bacterium]
MDGMIALDQITFTYPGQPPTLAGLSAHIPQGVTLLVGPNAGGKTTLLRLLAGLLEPQTGRFIETATNRALTAADRRRLARMVLQDADLQILGASVGDDVMLGQAASALGAAFAAEAAALTRSFGLAGQWHDPVTALSFGQKKKLCLLHALLAAPAMLLLDEPFVGLDYAAVSELRECIVANRRRGLTQVVCTHELEPVFDLADWLLVVGGGTLLAEGPPAALVDTLRDWSVRPPAGEWR